MRGWREEVEVVALSLRGYGNEEDDRPEKPRRYGVTEMRSPFYSFRPANQALQVRRRLTAASLPPLFWALRVLCSDSFGVLLCRARCLDWAYSNWECDSVSLECEYGLKPRLMIN
ncbi:unnamed protein product [Miscanthus lutarioriparius]|uniref:Uncharacterized protein n=1 Tax=Miscanthus lutarioriparius TaxID=422564 RepID=A0A811S8R9_9POAL|nr:unnamed protein product [Miscanthus lutarioriparius]